MLCIPLTIRSAGLHQAAAAAVVLLLVYPVAAARGAVHRGSVGRQAPARSVDYATIRRKFRTQLRWQRPAPQSAPGDRPPAGVTVVQYPSGPLRLKAWVGRPGPADRQRHAAVLFLHGGFAFGGDDWAMSRPYRHAGYV